jgi:hypothetical protein
MSNPAIVLMTDPSRCNLGDVQYLVQALLEMQQMGEHAIPQAFCDHPEAASDFINAYAHAYPQLVLEDRGIPTPDHLHSLISTGQIGPLGWPAELALSGDLQTPAGPNGANGLPIVMLTLGSSQALFDALQQAPAIRESIRLIDVGQERGDAISVAVADAVVSRELEAEPWQQERSRAERPELDDVSSAAKADLVSLALHDEQMSLDVVETVEVSSKEPSVYGQGGVPEPVVAAPSAAAAKPASATADDRSGAASADGSAADATGSVTETATEAALLPATQPAIEPVVVTRPSDIELIGSGEGDLVEPSEGDLVEPSEGDPGAQSPEPEAEAPDDAIDPGDERPPAGHAADKGGDKADKGFGKKADKQADVAEAAGKDATEQDDDVYYPPVGTLIAAADVLYPALDGGDAHGALHELASVLLDDNFLDSDLAADLMEAQRGEGLPVPARLEPIVAVRSGDNVVTSEDTYGAGGQESDDPLAGADIARPLHDSDL